MDKDGISARCRGIHAEGERSQEVASSRSKCIKAVEFALKAYADERLNRRIRSHSDAKSVAYGISEELGDKFTEFMDIYHGSYDREDGERIRRALKLMGEIEDEIRRRLAK